MCNVPFFQLKAEFQSRLANIIPVEKGSSLHFEILYDNSINNISNPDPNISINRGLNPADKEMADGTITFFDN